MTKEKIIITTKTPFLVALQESFKGVIPTTPRMLYPHQKMAWGLGTFDEWCVESTRKFLTKNGYNQNVTIERLMIDKVITPLYTPEELNKKTSDEIYDMIRNSSVTYRIVGDSECAIEIAVLISSLYGLHDGIIPDGAYADDIWKEYYSRSWCISVELEE